MQIERAVERAWQGARRLAKSSVSYMLKKVRLLLWKEPLLLMNDDSSHKDTATLSEIVTEVVFARHDEVEVEPVDVVDVDAEEEGDSSSSDGE